ncbi:MAG: phytanoyl-CoA dioxygenase family protein [Elusimicrobia bacterium]|nr:phytanoyl-CoA dioxygenase family protein [Elusimicrobiota bacterium]
MSLRAVSAAAPGAAAKIRAAMRRDGLAVVDGLFPKPLLKKLRDSVLKRHESGELRRRGLVRDIAGRYAAVIPFEGPFLDKRFYANSKVLKAMAALLGPDFCIGSLETVISLPGAYRQHLHIDSPIRFDTAIGKGKRRWRGDLTDLPPYAVTLCVPLVDLSEENGATALWPGSHKTALRPTPPSDAAIRRGFPEEHMVGPVGRCFFFDFRTFHCGMPNYTREPRPILMFVFTRSWYRDPNLTDVYPSVVVEKRRLKKMPEAHRKLFLLSPASRRPVWS